MLQLLRLPPWEANYHTLPKCVKDDKKHSTRECTKPEDKPLQMHQLRHRVPYQLPRMSHVPEMERIDTIGDEKKRNITNSKENQLEMIQRNTEQKPKADPNNQYKKRN